MQIKLYVLIDAAEAWVMGVDETELHSTFEEGIGCPPVHPTRVLSVIIEVPAPTNILLNAIVPAESIPSLPVTMEVKG